MKTILAVAMPGPVVVKNILRTVQRTQEWAILEEYPEDCPEDTGMGRGEIDKFPVNQLDARYDLARSAVYTRLKQLSIEPHRVGNKAYITGNELAWMDALHEFLKQPGRSAAEFIEANGLKPPTSNGSSNGNNSRNRTEPGMDLAPAGGDFGNFVRALSELVTRLQPAPDRMKRYADLEAAVQHQWQLSTADLAYLLDVDPDEILRCGDRFQDGGFIFTRAGYRRDGQPAWRVSKPGQW